MIDSVTDNICLISNVCTVSKEIAGKSPIALPSCDTSPAAALPSTDTSLVATSLLDNAPASVVTCTQSSSATSSTTTSSASTAAGQSSEVKASTSCASPTSSTLRASPTSKPTIGSPQLTLSSKDVEAIISNACKIARINVMDCTSPHGAAQVKRRERHRVRGRENLLKRLTEVNVACVFC